MPSLLSVLPWVKGDIIPTSKSVKANVLCTKKPKMAENDKAFKRIDEGVDDTSNELLWEPLTREKRVLKFALEQAQEYCGDKTLYDREWRLPTLDGLYVIIDHTHIRPSVDKSHVRCVSDMK